MTQIPEVPINHSLQSLREALEQAERQIGRLDRDNIKAFLISLDGIDQMFAAYGQETGAVRAEATRWQSLRQQMVAKPQLVVTAATNAGGLAKLRSQQASAVGPWWHLDTAVAQRRTQAQQRVGLAIGAVALVALVWWGVTTFFPSADPVTDTTTAIEQLVAAQKWPEALAVVQARQTQPADTDLLLWAAVLYEQVGNTASAESTLTQAQQQFSGDPAAFWTQVGNYRQQVGNLAGAEAAGQQALAMAPQDAQVTFLLGSVAEARGDVVQAAAYFSQTIALAGDANPELGVMTKVRMGNLMPRLEALPNPAPGATITQTATP